MREVRGGGAVPRVSFVHVASATILNISPRCAYCSQTTPQRLARAVAAAHTIPMSSCIDVYSWVSGVCDAASPSIVRRKRKLSSILDEMDPNVPSATLRSRRTRSQKLHHRIPQDENVPFADVDENPKATPSTSLPSFRPSSAIQARLRWR